MKFYKTETKLPKDNQIVLAKIKTNGKNNYYVCEFRHIKDLPMFVDTEDPFHWGYGAEYIEGWCSLTEIDKNIKWE